MVFLKILFHGRDVFPFLPGPPVSSLPGHPPPRRFALLPRRMAGAVGGDCFGRRWGAFPAEKAPWPGGGAGENLSVTAVTSPLSGETGERSVRAHSLLGSYVLFGNAAGSGKPPCHCGDIPPASWGDKGSGRRQRLTCFCLPGLPGRGTACGGGAFPGLPGFAAPGNLSGGQISAKNAAGQGGPLAVDEVLCGGAFPGGDSWLLRGEPHPSVQARTPSPKGEGFWVSGAELVGVEDTLRSLLFSLKVVRLRWWGVRVNLTPCPLY